MIYAGFFFLLTLQLIIMSKDIFGRERELCLLFIKNNKSHGLSFDFTISNSSVDLIVRYSKPGEWDQEKEEGILIAFGKILILLLLDIIVTVML